MADFTAVKPDDVCRHFDRVSWSLIEEPDICENCNYYMEDSGCCSCEAYISEGK